MQVWKELGVILFILLSLVGLSLGIDLQQRYNWVDTVLNGSNPFRVMDFTEMVLLAGLLLKYAFTVIKELIQQKKSKKASVAGK